MKEAYKQLDDREVYEEVPNNPNVLINSIMKALEKIRLRGDLASDTVNFFLVKDPRFARYYQKFINTYMTYRVEQLFETAAFKLSLFLDYHLQPLAQMAKSYIKDTNHLIR